jgi:hypothetical protein
LKLPVLIGDRVVGMIHDEDHAVHPDMAGIALQIYRPNSLRPNDPASTRLKDRASQSFLNAIFFRRICHAETVRAQQHKFAAAHLSVLRLGVSFVTGVHHFLDLILRHAHQLVGAPLHISARAANGAASSIDFVVNAVSDVGA